MKSNTFQRIGYTFIFLFLFSNLMATPVEQDSIRNKENSEQIKTDSLNVKTENKKDNIVRAEFPGGTKSLLNYLKVNIKYPKGEQKSGRVVLQFSINTDGTISEVTVLQGVSPVIDKTAVKIIEKMPLWYPAQKNGKPIKMRYTLPIVFRR